MAQVDNVLNATQQLAYNVKLLLILAPLVSIISISFNPNAKVYAQLLITHLMDNAWDVIVHVILALLLQFVYLVLITISLI